MDLSGALQKQHAVAIVPFEPSVTDDDYSAPVAVRRELEGIVLTVKNIDKFGEMGHRNYLFTGPPGTGKTLGVKYLATMCGGLVYDGKLVNSAEAVHDTFEQLRVIAKEEKKPLFFVVNEVDKFASRVDIVDPQQQRTLNALLDELQGFDRNEGIYVVGTTNDPDRLDHALRRPGRFSKEIEFLPPDKNGRLKILEIHAYRKSHKFEVAKKYLEALAAKTFGYTGADLCGLLDESFVEALRHDRTAVTSEDLEYGFSATKPSALRDMPFREPDKKLDDLAGYEWHKKLLRRIVGTNGGATMLFYGQPGTGKTAFAEALAGEYGYNLLFVSGSELESKWVGEAKDRLARVYSRAKQLRPCILVLDEVDSFFETRGVITHQKEQTGYAQSMLSKPEEGVYVVATTNCPQQLKDAMIDRFVYKLFFPLPDQKDQAAVWAKYLPEGVSPNDVVRSGLSCRTIADACKKVSTYGTCTIEAISRLAQSRCTHDDERAEEFEKLSRSIGDDVADYRALEARHA